MANGLSVMPENPSIARRPRLLLLAYACSPSRGSEGAVGWNRALQAARFCDTWVLCEEEHGYGPEIRDHLAHNGEVPGLTFVTHSMSPWQKRLAKVGALYWTAYHGWQRTAYRRAKQLHEELNFDLVHLVSYCGYREPGYAWKLDAPFIWGPLGGTQNFDLRFWREAGWRGAALEAARQAINGFHIRYRRRVHGAARSAAAILAANQRNATDLHQHLGVDPEVQMETGVAKFPGLDRDKPEHDDTLRLIWVGQCLRFKGCGLLLDALARLGGKTKFELRVIGDGPLRKRWQTKAERLGIADRVHWLGWRPYAEVLDQYNWADAFVFTSLRDTSGTVLFESLANGVPVITLNHQGAREIITDECGLKIPVNGPQQVTTDLHDAIVRLANDKGLQRRLQEGALKRAHYFSWQNQGDRMAQVYASVLAESGSDAQVGPPLLSNVSPPSNIRLAEFEEVSS